MKTLILDGSHAGDRFAGNVDAALKSRFPGAETIVIRDRKIGNCAGDFFCWVRNPGLCNVDDDNRLIAAKIAHSHLLVYLTPVTFGGYSSALKRMVDHQIQNVLPFFTTVEGEVHHQPRYTRYPALRAIGWSDQTDAHAAALFHHLVRRNALNMHAPSYGSLVVGTGLLEAELAARVQDWLDRPASSAAALPETEPGPGQSAPVRRAVLLVGSPRTRTSSSASLGGYLIHQLAAHGVQTETIQVYTAFNHPERTRLALEHIDSADLVALAFPLYVDSLPAPLTAALELIAAHRRKHPLAQRFTAIANCGFPESFHNDPALAICGQFAREAGLTWLGSLSLGGGHGIVHGTPLPELGGRAMNIMHGLDLAAGALAQGLPIPQQARALLARPVTPGWVYRLIGGIGWRIQARRYGVSGSLRRRPYAEVEPHA